MVTIRYTDVDEFYHAVKSYLTANEVENNLAIGAVNRCVGKKANSDQYFFVSKVAEIIVFVMIQTFKNMILVGETKYVDDAVETLMTEGVKIKGIISKYDLGEAFAKRWKIKTGSKWHIKMHQRIYQLSKVNEVRLVKGELRKANHKDKQILIDWMVKSSLELGGNMNKNEVEKEVSNYLKDELIYVWEDDEIVSMVRKTRPTENSIVVTSVFTPKKFRKKGYATSCVFTFTKLLLEDYKYCTLYTDLANLISNKIYKKIGYSAIADSVVISFDE